MNEKRQNKKIVPVVEDKSFLPSKKKNITNDSPTNEFKSSL
jgi:hypothetical protein